MLREELVFVATCDLSGHVRGKGFPAEEIHARLRKGVRWTHSQLMMSPFGPTWDTPFGTVGDLMIVPDPAAEVRVDFADGSVPEHFFLGDLRTADGAAWECCPREFLRRALAALEAAGGLSLTAAFEQEFVYTGTDDRPGDAFSLGAFRRQGRFGETSWPRCALPAWSRTRSSPSTGRGSSSSPSPRLRRSRPPTMR